MGIMYVYCLHTLTWFMINVLVWFAICYSARHKKGSQFNFSNLSWTKNVISICMEPYVTGFWKISPNVTFCNYEDLELSITFTMIAIHSSYLTLPEFTEKYFENSVVSLLKTKWVVYFTIFHCDIKTDFPKSGHIWSSTPVRLSFMHIHKFL